MPRSHRSQAAAVPGPRASGSSVWDGFFGERELIPWGISVEARVTLARIVAAVDRRALTQPDATDQLRELTRCLLLHRQAEDAIENGCDRSPWSRSLLDH